MIEDEQTTTWALERERASRSFGGAYPSNQTDAEIATVFAEHPAAVIAELAQLATAFDAGRVHSPWRALSAKLSKIVSDSTPVSLGREGREHLAESYIRNAGLYEPSAESLLDALFGDHGQLKAWAEDQPLRARVVALWEREHPRGVAADTAMLERAKSWRAAQERLDARELEDPNEPGPDVPIVVS